MIKQADGTSVDVDSLQVSDAMKDLLKVVDADDDGVVDDVNARDALRILSSMKARTEKSSTSDGAVPF